MSKSCENLKRLQIRHGVNSAVSVSQPAICCIPNEKILDTFWKQLKLPGSKPTQSVGGCWMLALKFSPCQQTYRVTMASLLEGDFIVFKARRDHKLIYCSLLLLNLTTALSIENNNFHYNKAIDSSVNQSVFMLQVYKQEGKTELKSLQPQVWYNHTFLVGDPHTYPKRKSSWFPGLSWVSRRIIFSPGRSESNQQFNTGYKTLRY